jgi:hypothetical protein
VGPRIVGAAAIQVSILEVRQAVRVVPGLHPRVGGPALVVERVAALEDLAVDARRAAKDPPASVIDPTAVHERLGLRFVPPVVEPAADREGERRRHVDEDVEPVVWSSSFEHQHASLRVGAQAVGQDAAGRAATDDDEVVATATHGLGC